MALATIINMSEQFRILVTGLPVSVNESSLLSEFKKFGEVQFIRLKKYPGSLSAFISFLSAESAFRARSHFNGKILFGSRINVCISDSFPIKDYRSNIFIKNIPPSVESIQLEEIFKCFGKILNSKISYNEKNQSRGYGFIMFEKPEDADLAVYKGNNAQIMNNILEVKHFVPKPQRPSNYSNVYVRGFNENFTQEALLAVFSNFGEVVSAVVNKNESGCYGFVCFLESTSAEKAIFTLQGKKHASGFEWYLSRNLSKSERNLENKLKLKKNEEKWMKNNLYIKGWPADLNEDQLVSVFSKFGVIESVKILTQECLTLVSNYPVTEVKPTGKAFICFKDEKSADIAIYHMKNTLINNSPLKLFRWVPKSVLFHNKIIRSKTKISPQRINFKVYDPVPFFNFEKFKNAKPEEKKRIFGEAIYQEIFNIYDKWTGKITGMIIELDESELLPMMEQKNLLYSKAKEAMNILNSQLITL